MAAAPNAYRDTRAKTVDYVKGGLRATADLKTITPAVIKKLPGILPTLRMSMCPPLARDRLIGLADSSKSLVGSLEKGKLPPRISPQVLDKHLQRIADILTRMLDIDIFPWITERRRPREEERYRSSTIVADRLCGAIAEPIVRNAQEKRQLALIEKYLTGRGYRKQPHPASQPLNEMRPGTFTFRLNIKVRKTPESTATINIPGDVVIQPKKTKLPHLPVIIEAKSAGDFTNVNKRRKEEATKMSQLRATYGNQIILVLFLCGYFDAGYLGYEAAEGIDWIWEHRIKDLNQLGL